MPAKSKQISTLHEFIMSMAAHTGFSLGGFADKKDALIFEPIVGIDGTTDSGPNQLIPEMVNQFDALEALRAAMFGTGPGNPSVREIHSLLEAVEGTDPTYARVKILQYNGDSPGDPVPGPFILNDPNTTWEALFSAQQQSIDESKATSDEKPDVVTEEEKAALPDVYNICTTDISLSREVGNAEAIHLFMNTIPTIEFSRCVPYLDVQFFGPVKTLSDGSEAVDSDGVPSLYRFILGTDEYKSSVWGNTTNRLEMPDASEDVSETSEKARVRNTSGMEVFLSPQTLVNADERTTASRTGGFHGLTNGVVDPFRPFMSLTGLTLNIAPQVNSIIFSEGTLTFTLHDKSRLPEISSLVSPKNMGQVYMTITYGWSHPDGTGTTDMTVGKFLDSLKTTETFIISNSSYTFTPTGEVNVTLSIAASGAQQMIDSGKILDDSCISDTRMLEQLEELIVLIRDSLPDKIHGIPTTRVKQKLEAAGKGAGLFTADLGRMGFRDLIQTARKADLDANAALKKLEEITGGGDNIADLTTRKTNISDAWKSKLVATISNPDPFLVWDTCWEAKKAPASYRNDSLKDKPSIAKYLSKTAVTTSEPAKAAKYRDYVSIGKLFNAYVVAPLLHSPNFPDFDEVQVYWGVLNDRASYLKNQNISSIPIKTSDLVDIMNSVKEAQGPNIGIYDFIGMIQNAFFDNQAWEAYGFSEGRTSGSSYKRTVNKDTGLFDYKEKENANSLENAADKRMNVLLKAYENTGPFEFKQPLIKVSFEAPPIEPMDPNESDIGGAGSTKQTKILKIFVEDEKSMSYSGAVDLMQRVFEDYVPSAVNTAPVDDEPTSADSSRRASQNRAMSFAEEMGLMSISAGRLTFAGGQAYKSILKSFAPSIEIGSSNSAIFAASVQNMGGTGNLRDVHMLKGSDPSSESVEEDIMPVTMMPQQMTLTLPGMPLLAPLITMFVDMKTGTDIDALYSVQSVSHNVAAGKFVTTANLLYTGGYAVFKDLTQRLGDVASQMSSLLGEDLEIVIEDQVAAHADNYEDIVEKAREESEAFNQSLIAVGYDAGQLNEDNKEEAKVREADAIKEAKDARTAALRAFKPAEAMRLLNKHSDLAKQYKARLAQDLTPESKEQAQTHYDKNKKLAEGLIAQMEKWLDSSFADDTDDTQKSRWNFNIAVYEARL